MELFQGCPQETLSVTLKSSVSGWPLQCSEMFFHVLFPPTHATKIRPNIFLASTSSLKVSQGAHQSTRIDWDIANATVTRPCMPHHSSDRQRSSPKQCLNPAATLIYIVIYRVETATQMSAPARTLEDQKKTLRSHSLPESRPSRQLPRRPWKKRLHFLSISKITPCLIRNCYIKISRCIKYQVHLSSRCIPFMFPSKSEVLENKVRGLRNLMAATSAEWHWTTSKRLPVGSLKMHGPTPLPVSKFLKNECCRRTRKSPGLHLWHSQLQDASAVNWRGVFFQVWKFTLQRLSTKFVWRYELMQCHATQMGILDEIYMKW